MDPFIDYLQTAKHSANILDSSTGTPIHIVMGNESCDLDSMISALALGYLNHHKSIKKQPTSCALVIPILNIPSDEFALRTENYYVLKQLGIDQNVLVFRNQINLQDIQNRGLLSISLVDHHVLRPEDGFLESSVVEIFDHRPIDPNAAWNNNKVQIRIEQVGCCSSLITDKILKEEPNILTSVLTTLLYNVITFDTIAFSPEAGKVKELDIEVSTELVKRFSLQQDSKALFDELWKAHNDVSHLTPKQLLSKDLKVVEGLPLPGLPMLVRDYFKFPNVVQDMTDFCKEKCSSTMVIIGLHVIENKVHRDIAVFTTNGDRRLADAIISNLKEAQELKGYDFCLEEVAVGIPGVTYFIQKNVKLTRKHILPLIKETVTQNNT